MKIPCVLIEFLELFSLILRKYMVGRYDRGTPKTQEKYSERILTYSTQSDKDSPKSPKKTLREKYSERMFL